MGIKVLATRHGVYGQYRHPGDEFMIEKEEDFSENWMERVAEEGVGAPPAPSGHGFVFTEVEDAIRHYTVEEMAADPAKREQMVDLMKKVYPEGYEPMVKHLDDAIAAFNSGQETQ